MIQILEACISSPKFYKYPKKTKKNGAVGVHGSDQTNVLNPTTLSGCRKLYQLMTIEKRGNPDSSLLMSADLKDPLGGKCCTWHPQG